MNDSPSPGKPHFCGMKNLLIILILLLVSPSPDAAAQTKTDSLPYQKYPTLPAFNLLMADSSTIFNTYNVTEGRPTVLFFFAPDCEHCHTIAKGLLGKMDSLKAADFYFFSYVPLAALSSFAAQYHLADYKNITIGKDYQYFFPSFYGATTIPYVVVYDGHKKLVKLYDNGAKATDLIRLLNSL